MKSVNQMPRYDATMFMKKNNEMLEAQIMLSSLEMGLFEYLSEPISAEKLAQDYNYHKNNLVWLLNALTAMEFLEKKNDNYQNLPPTDYYLNPKSDMYLGDHLLYWKEMTSLENLTERVKEGPASRIFQDDNGSDFFDFRSMGKGAQNTMYLGRVQDFIKKISTLFQEQETFSVLDLGAGSGILSIEIVRNFPNAKALLFDQPEVVALTQQNIDEYGVASNAKVQAGNFMENDIEGKYDLIIAAGIMDFVGDLDEMVYKMDQLLSKNGKIYVHTHGLSEDFTRPKTMVLGWLSSHLDGLSILKSDKQIQEAFERAGFFLTKDPENPGHYVAGKL